MVRSATVVALAALASLAACTAGPEPPSVAPTTSPPATSPSAEEGPLAVVTHATGPQLDLTSTQVRRLAAGEVRRWRGLRVVTGGVRAVEADPRALAVVPLDEVGPTVVAARVDGVDPVRDDPRAVDVAVAGDLMLVRRVPDPRAALAAMAPRLRAADLTVGNLESTLSTAGPPTQEDFFGGTPALLRPLGRAGFDALSLANNHTGDHGDRALLETVAAFRGSRVRPFGAGRGLAASSRPAYLERGGVRFALVGFNAIGETPRATPTTPGALSVRMPPRTGPLVTADLRHVREVVRRADRRADVVVVLPHWGEQYTHRPEPVQRRVARALVAAGADLVVGGHPHWVQGVDVVRRDGRAVPVLHSLGNFVFDMDFYPEAMEGVVLEATFWGADLKALRLVPYRMDPTSFAPREVSGAAAAEVLADVWSTSTGPFAR